MASPSAQQSRILIVEDEPIVLEVCHRILELAGFETILARHGREGLDFYVTRCSEIALTISDVAMPVMDGLEMLRGIFRVDPHANVILMTGYSVNTAVPEDLGKMCKVLKKPFLPRQFLSAVNDCLGRKQKGQSA